MPGNVGDDLEDPEMTLEVLGDSDAVGRIAESLAALGRDWRIPDWARSSIVATGIANEAFVVAQ